jgi:hypothetical protein
MHKLRWVVKIVGPKGDRYVSEDNSLQDVKMGARTFYTQSMASLVGNGIVAIEGPGHSFVIDTEAVANEAEIIPEIAT